jgi:hypothetical protein
LRKFREYSDQYPAANRPETAWPYSKIDISVLSAAGQKLFDPNTLAIAIHRAELDNLVPLGNVRSDLSGEPALLVGYDEVELALTIDELKRLGCRILEAGEFFKLAEKYGIFYEISGKFYDEETGRSHALQDEHIEKMAALMADDTLVLSQLRDGRVRVAFEEGPVVHEGLNADAAQLRILLMTLGYTVEEPATPCWSCERPVTEKERSENDGFCPHCMAELSNEE